MGLGGTGDGRTAWAPSRLLAKRMRSGRRSSWRCSRTARPAFTPSRDGRTAAPGNRRKRLRACHRMVGVAVTISARREIVYDGSTITPSSMRHRASRAPRRDADDREIGSPGMVFAAAARSGATVASREDAASGLASIRAAQSSAADGRPQLDLACSMRASRWRGAAGRAVRSICTTLRLAVAVSVACFEDGLEFEMSIFVLAMPGGKQTTAATTQRRRIPSATSPVIGRPRPAHDASQQR